MQATTVRVDAAVKEDLDRLQGYVQSEQASRISHSELLRRLLRYASRDPDRFLAESDGGVPGRPWTREQWEAWSSSLVPWGVKTDVSRLDEELYQDPHSAWQPVPRRRRAPGRRNPR